MCKACKRAYDNAHYASHPDRRVYIRENSNARMLIVHQQVWDYLAAHPCVDCGETDPVVLDFDHRDPQTKKYNVSVLRRNARESLLWEEIKKCDVRCSNCHRRRTAQQFGWYTRLNLAPVAQSGRATHL